MAIRTFILKLITFVFMASLVSASETSITSRSDFENLVINKKLERFLISLSVTGAVSYTHLTLPTILRV